MHKFKVVFYVGKERFEEIVRANSGLAAEKLIKARYPEAKINTVVSMVG